MTELARREFLRRAIGVSLLGAGDGYVTHAIAQAKAPRTPGESGEVLGKYYFKKSYSPAPLPQWQTIHGQLPAPIYDSRPDWISMYWKSWEIAFHNFYEPAPGSGFVSQFIDAAFNANIFLWDSCFMTMFCNYAHPLVPGIGTLDNFYAKQHEDGEICREIVRHTGVDFPQWVNRENRPLFSRWGKEPSNPNVPYDVVYRGRPAPKQNPKLTLDALNHPILAWAELESYRITGDKARLGHVWEPLVHYYAALQEYLRQGNGLYMTDWASMDNSTRNVYLDRGGTGIDISAEMVLFARQMAEIARIQGKAADASRFASDADELSAIINQSMWDSRQSFYFDLTLDGKRAPVKTIAAFWPLLAKVASREQAEALATQLENPGTFKRLHRVPTLAADEPGYDPAGGYWRGAVWAPADTMVIRGLENYGHDALAREIALNHLNMAAQVFEKTGTIWENYAPDRVVQGKPAKANFAGWSAIGPIVYLLEYAIGLRANAPANSLAWNLTPGIRQGCDRFRFNDHVASLQAKPIVGTENAFQIEVDSDGEFKLELSSGRTRKTIDIKPGQQKVQV